MTYNGLGFDPAPGELDAVTRAIEQLTAIAGAQTGIEPALRRAEQVSAGWQGAAAEAFRARLRETSAGSGTGAPALRRAAGVLDRWAEVLVANKRRAEELDQRALRLRKRIGLAADELQDRQNAADLAATPAAATSASAELAAMTTLLSDLRSALAEVLAEARRLERDHLRAADGFADELERAPRAGPAEPDPGAIRPAARPAADALAGTAQVSGTIARLLQRSGSGVGPPMVAVPRGAAGALAAALRSRDEPSGEAAGR